jgi:hypothetical protein
MGKAVAMIQEMQVGRRGTSTLELSKNKLAIKEEYDN